MMDKPKKIRRYDSGSCHADDCECLSMNENETGYYVEYDEAEALIKELTKCLKDIVDCRTIPNKGPLSLWTNARNAIEKSEASL